MELSSAGLGVTRVAEVDKKYSRAGVIIRPAPDTLLIESDVSYA
jgi:hypothetical protein